MQRHPYHHNHPPQHTHSLDLQLDGVRGEVREHSQMGIISSHLWLRITSGKC